MMMLRPALAIQLVVFLSSSIGWAQPTVAPATAGDGAAAPQNSTGTSAGTSASTQTVFVPPFGVPFMGQDPNANLPSSSRPTTNASSAGDEFDLGQSKDGDQVWHGSKGTLAITGATRAPAVTIPEIYLIKRGDTLWDISEHYLDNPWQWPRLWSYNPDIRNPNWIYPGDRLRLLKGGRGDTAGGGPSGLGSGAKGLAGPGGTGDSTSRLLRNTGRVTPDTLFLRDEAYIGDPAKDTWGEVVGAREEQMLLSRGNHIYLDVKNGVTPKVGQEVTIFEALRKPAAVEGARMPPGQIVRIKGTVKITDFDAKKHVASGEIVEAVDAIERGAKIGDVEREYRVVPPTIATKTVWAHILTSIHPHVYMGQNQLVFLDRGSEDGLSIGNRLLVVRRGDVWRQSLVTTTRSARDTLHIDSPEPAEIRTTTLRRSDRDFPEEIVAQLRIVQASRYSSTAVVAESKKEVVVGDLAVAREGY